MPSNSRRPNRRVRRYGGDVVVCETTLARAKPPGRQVMERTGAAFIHPYDDLRVMAGQGTTPSKLLEESDLDISFLVPGAAADSFAEGRGDDGLRRSCRVGGREPAGDEDARARLLKADTSFQTSPRTIADGLKTSMGERISTEISRCRRHRDGCARDSSVQQGGCKVGFSLFVSFFCFFRRSDETHR